MVCVYAASDCPTYFIYNMSGQTVFHLNGAANENLSLVSVTQLILLHGSKNPSVIPGIIHNSS